MGRRCRRAGGASGERAALGSAALPREAAARGASCARERGGAAGCRFAGSELRSGARRCRGMPLRGERASLGSAALPREAAARGASCARERGRCRGKPLRGERAALGNAGFAAGCRCAGKRAALGSAGVAAGCRCAGSELRSGARLRRGMPLRGEASCARERGRCRGSGVPPQAIPAGSRRRRSPQDPAAGDPAAGAPQAFPGEAGSRRRRSPAKPAPAAGAPRRRSQAKPAPAAGASRRRRIPGEAGSRAKPVLALSRCGAVRGGDGVVRSDGSGGSDGGDGGDGVTAV
jgi:hypothetical protein